MNHKRLHTRLLALLLCCALVLPLSACGEAKSTTQQIFAMDTVMDLTAYGKKADDGISAAISIINSMDTLLDPENERSKTYEINHAMGSSVVVNEQIAKMLRTAQTVYERSDGALDLTTYPLSKLWGFIDQNYRVPSDAEIERLLPCVDMSKVQLAATDDSANYLVTMPADMSLSFGAVAKGCASDYAIQAMRAAGVTSGVVSLGGNVQTLGKKPDGSDWNIAVQDPNDTGSYLGYLTVGETAVITSGSYQRFFTEGGQKYHHILSPKTGRPVNNGLLSVTIVCEDGTLADCLSTAMFVLGPQAALNYWRTYGGFEMVLVKSDGHVVLTNGLYGSSPPTATTTSSSMRAEKHETARSGIFPARRALRRAGLGWAHPGAPTAGRHAAACAHHGDGGLPRRAGHRLSRLPRPDKAHGGALSRRRHDLRLPLLRHALDAQHRDRARG